MSIFSLPVNFQHTFRSFKYRNYRLYFIGQGVSLIGTWMQQAAMPWLVYRLTGSVLLLGIVGFASMIPSSILTPIAGVMLDRWNRHRVLLITQVLSMLQALMLAALFFTGVIQVWHIMVMGIFLGCINAFDMPTRQSFIVDLVEDKQDLANVVALNASLFNGARLVGPSLAGMIIAVAGEGVCFLVNGASFICIIVTLLLMKIPCRTVNKTSGHMKDFKEGLKYVFGFPPIRSIILLLALVSLMGLPYMVLMPAIAKDMLQGDAYTYGFLMAATGVGALTGAFYLASRKTVVGLTKVIPISIAIFGCGLVLFSLSRSFWLSAGLMYFTGLGMMMHMASGNTILQTIVDDDKRGRAMSFYILAFMGIAPWGSLLTGSVAHAIGTPATLAIGGGVCILGAIIFAFQLRAINKAVHPIYVRLGILPPVSAGLQAATQLTTPKE
ncbi:MAG TPA: MFS transporter [Planctomycetota bacterium]|nr:MFS transporter [Planctomycetota bacterium]